jgi:hypothetical protein
MNRNLALRARRALSWTLAVGLTFAAAAECAAIVPAAAPPTGCPGAVNSPALTQLQTAAATGDMSAVTGDGCPQTPGSVAPAGPTTTIPTTPQPPTPPAAPVPSVTDQGKPEGGGFMSGIKSKFTDFIHGMPINQTLAGVGFGAAFGMLLGVGGPLGLIGGMLLGAAIGGILGSGIFGKLFGGGGTGGS